MKRKIFTGLFLLLLATISSTINAQKISADKVPPAASAAFKIKFPKAEKVKWEMEDKKDFEANFTFGGVEQSATFTSEGKWLETETEIKTSDLPTAVQQTVSKQFAGYKIKEASKVENEKNGNFYEVEVSKGKEVFEIALTNTGEVLSKKDVSKDKEDKD